MSNSTMGERPASPAYADVSRPAREWERLAKRLLADGERAAALFAAARATGVSGRPEAFRDTLVAEAAEITSGEDKTAYTAVGSADGDLNEAMDAIGEALRKGNPPAKMLRRASECLAERKRPRAAHDLEEAARALEG